VGEVVNALLYFLNQRLLGQIGEEDGRGERQYQEREQHDDQLGGQTESVEKLVVEGTERRQHDQTVQEGRTARSTACATHPSRMSRGGLTVVSRTVLGSPPGVGPPLTIRSTSAPKARSTSAAVVAGR